MGKSVRSRILTYLSSIEYPHLLSSRNLVTFADEVRQRKTDIPAILAGNKRDVHNRLLGEREKQEVITRTIPTINIIN